MVIVIAIALAILIVWLERYLFGKNWYKHLEVSITFLQEGLHPGEKGLLQEVVINDKRMPLPVLEVKFMTSSNLVFGDMSNSTVTDNYYRRDIYSLKERQKITRTMYFTAKKRGCYRITDFDVNSRDYLMGKAFYVNGKEETKLLVYPLKYDTQDYMTYFNKYVGEQIVRKRLIEDPLMFRSIREYSYTDPMRSINWKSSARHGQLMVNTYESTNSRKVCVILDMDSQANYDKDEIAEASISIISSICDAFLDQAVTVWLRGNARDSEGIECLSTEGQDYKVHIKNIDMSLACVATDQKPESIDNIIVKCVEEFGSEASYILVSSKRREKLRSIAQYYSREGMSFSCILPYSRREMKNLLQTDNEYDEDVMYDEYVFPWRI